MTRVLPNPLSARSTWPLVKFGDVVKNVTESCTDPESEGLERYLGLEHLDAGELAIRRWGDLTTDEVSFTRRFRKGQVLFGKRRAYQRKVAVAEFDGVCSSDILCFEPKDPQVLLPDLLPFICQTDAFFQHALGTSAGSLSPRTRWSQLKTFEFPLPPPNEQKRLAELLWATDATAERWLDVGARVDEWVDAQSSEYLQRGWQPTQLGELLVDLQYGSSQRIQPRDDTTIPILRIPNVVGGKINLSDLGHVRLSDRDAQKYRVDDGDVLIVRTNGNPDYVGRTAVAMQAPEQCVYASYLIRLRPDRSRLDPTFLHLALSSSLLRRTLRHEIRSSAGNYNLNTRGIRRQAIPLPPLDAQQRLVSHVTQAEKRRELIDEHIRHCQELKACLLNTHFNAEGDHD